ncbi:MULTISPECIES: Na+/H+ antiporter NhaC [Bacillus]|uniref:Na+/H+ antiporter NhaC n=1 Tax=Bacillus glycinifermentans TaxID=1664069 RepID=A0AAJ3YW72_9BACI|nr:MULTISPECIES: Na+/H+ antiporter NhaC [Bacillus]KKB74860.1 sodium:proton antiporter [Bacillus sp. TH008]MDU0071536.1 Na+/H+ antiporter NhaC [Bacillus sp. IG6]MED8019371.1 Na+/H+ antiporter NhaC [Bacillus glycinifermentans]QAT64450.1 Na+/H+ antiporter NhaC [Bacillus glycinifermentans]WKB78387.1 Na+/H+ antiporter NhaC [Bacillus glycinifermentans]
MSNEKRLSFSISAFLFLAILSIIFICLFIFHAEPHMPLLICIGFLGVVSVLKGFSWKELESGIVSGIKSGVQPIIVLALIGILIGVWEYSGAIPTVTVYALNLIEPQFLLLTALFSCMIISSLVGSSFTTVSTIGVALMGVASAAGLPLTWVAGAVICGACFGDKMSPLSDTTNFASGVGEIPIFKHIRHMTGTTIPALLITVLLFFFMGRSLTIASASTENIETIVNGIENTVGISAWSLLSPLVVIVMAVRRMPVIPALAAGILSAGVLAAFIQPDAGISSFLSAMQKGPVFSAGNEAVENILNRGGLQSMLGSISLIMIAFALGGLMEKTRLIKSLLEGVIKGIRSKGRLVFSTVSSSIAMNLLTGEQYLSILIPGQSFKALYDKLEIDRKHLTRSLEDGGTLVNPLIPWGVSGAFMSSALGVSVIDYLPFVFFLYISPLFSILFGFRKQ